MFAHLPVLPLGEGASLLVVVLDSRSAACSTRDFARVFDSLGAASAHTQRLPAPITSTQRVAADVTQRAYIALDESGHPLGFLKVGVRTLYLALPARAAFGRFPDPGSLVGSRGGGGCGGGPRGAAGAGVASRDGGLRRLGGAGTMWECAPLCVLDFFVTEEERRRGVGRALMDSVLRNEGAPHPAVLAFVRTTPRAGRISLPSAPAAWLLSPKLHLPPPPTPAGPPLEDVPLLFAEALWVARVRAADQQLCAL